MNPTAPYQSTLTRDTLVHSESTASGTAPPCEVSQIGEFKLLKKLGEGSFGQVYLALQQSLGRLVALKISVRNETGRDEGQLLAGLEHDHIVKVFSGFTDPDSGLSGICLQYVPGIHLGSLIRQLHADGRMPESGKAILEVLDRNREGDVAFDPASLRDRDALAGETFPQSVCRLGTRLAEALAFAHGKGILHCDIKPANILITPYGRPMLADFNVAFNLARRGEGETICGTMAYTAPEHNAAIRCLPGGRVDERSDIYSLGIVLQEVGTGIRPREMTESIEPSEEGARDCSDPLDRLPRELAAVIRRCLVHDAGKRYQSAADLARALTGAWHLLAAQRLIPEAGRVGRWVVAFPIAAIVLAGCLPHIAASAANISYNAVQIQLSDAQMDAFARVILVYNLVAYPLLLGIAAIYLVRLHRDHRTVNAASGVQLRQVRKRAKNWGWWIMGLGVCGWLPGGLLFPLAIDLMAGPVPWQSYLHFGVSFALAGLIGVVFSYLLTQYVVLRGFLPRLGDPDEDSPARIGTELQALTALYPLFLTLACAVPLTGAVLLIVLADGALSLGFRLLVAALIGLGVAAVGTAERLIRVLRSLAAAWQ